MIFKNVKLSFLNTFDVIIIEMILMILLPFFISNEDFDVERRL